MSDAEAGGRGTDCERAERLYEEARTLPVEARASFLADACPDDPGLRAEVASLLEGARPAEEFFATLASAVGSMARAEGAMVGHYRLGARIGTGGMGVVYRAYDARLDREVALKFLPAYLSASTEAVEQLFAEARAAAALEHPNVCTVHEIGEAPDGRPFIAMALIEGEDLKTRLERGPVSPEEAIRIAAQIAAALAVAHSRSVVHRDVKPANVMLTAEGTVKLLDFGIARMIDATSPRPETTAGTLAYMSPEQARGDPVDARTDLWSLGVVLYEMLAGTRPFRGGSDRALYQAIQDREPEPLVGREAPMPALQVIVSRLLEKDPGDRYGAAREVLADLATAATGTAGVSGLRPRLDRLARGLAGRRRVAVACLVGATLLAAGAWWSLAPMRTDAPSALVPAATTSTASSAASGVAVLPFRTVGGDVGMLREGMVDLLSFNLDEIAGLRKIDPMSVMTTLNSVVGEGRDAPEHEALAVANRLGARYAILGSVVQLGETGGMRLTADVYEVAGSRRRGSVHLEGRADSLSALVDALTIEVIKRNLLPTGGELPPVNLSRVTTSSLPALKAYLAGEQAYRRARWREAADEFERAVELDSTFARALYRLALAIAWTGSGEAAHEYNDRAASLAFRLSRRDSILVSQKSSPEAVPVLEDFTARYPDDADGWHLLGERLFHHGGSLLHPPAAYRRALERAVVLAPHYGESYVHLIEDAFAHLDSARVRRFIAGAEALDPADPPCPVYRLIYDTRWGSDAARSAAAAVLDSLPAEAFECAYIAIAASPAALATAEERLLSAVQARKREFLGPLLGVGEARMWNGQLAAAQRLNDAARTSINLDAEAAAALRTLVTHLSGYPGTEGVAEAARTVALIPPTHRWFHRSRFWLGARAVARQQWDEAAQARLALEDQARRDSSGQPTRAAEAAAYAAALRAFEGVRRGDQDDLGELEAALTELEEDGHISSAFLRYDVAKLLLRRGRAREAERYFLSLYPYASWHFVPAQYYLGRIYEEAGQVELARGRYALFLAWWANCDPALRSWRQMGEVALARLGGEG